MRKLLARLSRTLATAAVLLFAMPVSIAQDEKQLSQFVLDTWQAQQGLSQNTIERLLRSSDGYLWLATHGGVLPR
ncbi:MAG: hypothetical protein ACREPE_06600 [Lysobacter sp.]